LAKRTDKEMVGGNFTAARSGSLGKSLRAIERLLLNTRKEGEYQAARE
jgi:hypothetical protein